jgi:dCMP deaminase
MNSKLELTEKVVEIALACDARPDWDDYFMAMAVLMSCRSICTRLKVGCLMVSKGEYKNRVIAAGYNGFVAGAPHISRVRDDHEQSVVHAEQNAVTDAARRGVSVDGAVAYISHFPCINCAKVMVSAGIKEIKYHFDYRNDALVFERLLIATPAVKDRNFSKTVSLVAKYSDCGTIGVIVNRPALMTIGGYSHKYSHSVISDNPLYYGGPVNSKHITMTAWIPHDTGCGYELRYNVTKNEAEEISIREEGAQIRGYLGCASWAPYQLLMEILRGDWLIADINYLFETRERGEKLWEAMVARINPGMLLLRELPEDPSLN